MNNFVPLGQLAELTVGHVGSMTSEYRTEGIPFLRSLNVKPYKLDLDGVKFVSQDFHAKLRKSALKPGDVVIVRTGKPGTCAVIPASLQNSNCSDLVIVRCGKDLRPHFLSYWINSLVSNHISSNLVGAVQQHFNVGAAKTMPVPCFGLDSQDEILGVLKALDDKIENNRRMNETLEAMAQVIFKDWFVDFGPVHRRASGMTDPVALLGGLITDPEKAAKTAALFPGGFGDNGLPDGWEERPYSDCIKIIGGGTPKTSVEEYWGDEIPWFSVTDTPSGSDTFVFDTEKRISSAGVANSSAKPVSAGTTIITARGTVGNLAIAGQEMAFNQSCYAIKPKSVATPYLVYLRTKMVVSQLQSMAHGSVFSTITRTTFDNVRVNTASNEIELNFEKMVSTLFDRINMAVVENKTLAETRDYLLPRLMSGQIQAGKI